MANPIHPKVKVAALVALLLGAIQTALAAGDVTLPATVLVYVNLVLPVLSAYFTKADAGTS